MEPLSEALLPPSGHNETCSSPRAGQGLFSTEKGPQSYSQHMHPCTVPASPLPHPKPQTFLGEKKHHQQLASQSETPGMRQC